MANPFWKEGFGPLLPDTEAVPFGDLDELARKLASRRFAAFVVEPGDAGPRSIATYRDLLSDGDLRARARLSAGCEP